MNENNERLNDTVVSFHDNNGEVGRIEFSSGVIKFVGNAEESAKLFFENLLKNIVDRYVNEKLSSFNDDVQKAVKEELNKYDGYRIKISYKKTDMINL